MPVSIENSDIYILHIWI